MILNPWNFLVMLCPWNPSSSFFSFWRNKRFCLKTSSVYLSKEPLIVQRQQQQYTTQSTLFYSFISIFLSLQIIILRNSKFCNRNSLYFSLGPWNESCRLLKRRGILRVFCGPIFAGKFWVACLALSTPSVDVNNNLTI